MSPVPVLLVDDDTELCTSLTRLLRMEGFEAKAVHEAGSAASEALKDQYQLVILDVMLPGGNGRQVLRAIRASSQVPVIMLTARRDEADRVSGLEAGADDYLPKPFSPRELVARMRAVLRRKSPAANTGIFRIDDLEIHTMSRRVLQAGTELALTGAEFDILVLLARSTGKVFSRSEIAEAALGRPIAPLDRSIDNHISNLRKKLGAWVHRRERIRNLRGTGYIYTGAGQ